jgi:hypothetical protein
LEEHDFAGGGAGLPEVDIFLEECGVLLVEGSVVDFGGANGRREGAEAEVASR